MFRTQFSSYPPEAKECFRPVCVGSIMAHAGLVFHGGCLQIAVKRRFEFGPDQTFAAFAPGFELLNDGRQRSAALFDSQILFSRDIAPKLQA